MRYILSEDEGAGLNFYKCLSAILGVCDVRSSFGNQNFQDVMLKLFTDTLSSGDSLLLAFDNIVPVAKFNPRDIVRQALQLGNEKGITVRYTLYYCFEEVYLSYSELLYLCRYYNFRDLDLLQAVHDAIMCKKNYYDRTNLMISDFISRYKGAGKGREKFCKYLLAAATQSIKHGYFKQDSGNFGACWLNPCKHQYAGLCDKCQHRIKAGGRVKLEHLETHSMSVLYCPFSDFFKN